MNYEFHPDAEQELYEAALHYESEVRGLGLRFRDEVARVVQMILDHPKWDRGSTVNSGISFSGVFLSPSCTRRRRI